MQNLSNEDLTKLSEFLNSVDGLINGKFILPDIKISNILKLISQNNFLYDYIKQCLQNFNFEEELYKSLAKNNNGVFVMPRERSKIVALVFCFLVECDAKKIDFFGFIKENFKKSTNFSEYYIFANTMLLPFKEAIYNDFNGNKEEPIEEPKVESNDIFTNLKKHLNQMLDNITLERKIRSFDKENLNYIIKNIIYSMKYRDLNIVNAFVSVLDILADKYACLRLPLKDIKSELLNYYNKK